MSEPIKFEVKDQIARVTFNRPEQHNAISYDGWLKLIEIANKIEEDSSIRSAVFLGEGEKSFSAGADIKDFETHRKDSETAKIYSKAFDGALDAIEALSVPTISMIRGICVGGGCELSMATDIRIASNKSRFGIPVAKLGILVGYREMKRLVNLVGPGNASYILLSGRLIDSTEAFRMGLITQLVDDPALEDTVLNLANEITPLAPLSQKRHKIILQNVISNQSLDGLDQELPFTNFDSTDFQEGKDAFISRRPPNFKGI